MPTHAHPQSDPAAVDNLRLARRAVEILTPEEPEEEPEPEPEDEGGQS